MRECARRRNGGGKRGRRNPNGRGRGPMNKRDGKGPHGSGRRNRYKLYDDCPND